MSNDCEGKFTKFGDPDIYNFLKNGFAQNSQFSENWDYNLEDCI